MACVYVQVRALCPRCVIIGAEPKAADDAARSKAAGVLLSHDTLPDTLADGLRTVLGSWTWPVVRDTVSGKLVTVFVFEWKKGGKTCSFGYGPGDW
jgi:threonine dehydratase